MANLVSVEKRNTILRMLVEGNSVSSVRRLMDMHAARIERSFSCAGIIAAVSTPFQLSIRQLLCAVACFSVSAGSLSTLVTHVYGDDALTPLWLILLSSISIGLGIGAVAGNSRIMRWIIIVLAITLALYVVLSLAAGIFFSRR